MTSSSKRRAIALGLAGAVTLATPSFAAPVLSNTASLKTAVSDNVVDVQWRRWHRHRGAGIAAGLAFGALAGAVIGAATAPSYYYGYPAYSGYGYPAYAYTYPSYGGYAYENAPVYAAPTAPVYGSVYYQRPYAYPYRTCVVDAGYGRWDYSQC